MCSDRGENRSSVAACACIGSMSIFLVRSTHTRTVVWTHLSVDEADLTTRVAIAPRELGSDCRGVHVWDVRCTGHMYSTLSSCTWSLNRLTQASTSTAT